MAAVEHLQPQQFEAKKTTPPIRARREHIVRYSPDWDKPEQARREISRSADQLF